LRDTASSVFKTPFISLPQLIGIHLGDRSRPAFEEAAASQRLKAKALATGRASEITRHAAVALHQVERA